MSTPAGAVEPPPIGPVPTAVGLGTAQFGTDRYVVVQFSTPTGAALYFLSPESAKELCAALTIQAAQASSGIVIAGMGDVPPLPPQAGGN